ncbi:hypothetical protein [Deinococcus aquaticus]|uniref:hypothetical protein n=1 Tax=Deinococcus aquaticus TaxID=328692 RepID=UPI0036177207
MTGQPYAPNPTKLADYGRIIAEFWADGPRAETPPATGTSWRTPSATTPASPTGWAARARRCPAWNGT